MNLEDLGSKILNKKQRETLIANGINSVEDLAFASIQKIVGFTGFGEKTAKKAWETAIREVHGEMFMPAIEAYEKRKLVKRVSTGSSDLDKLVGGGVETMSITEVSGAFGVGKTQLSHQLAVNVQKPECDGGLNGNVIYFDTEGTFRPERIIEIGGEKSLDGITYAPVYTVDHQFFLLNSPFGTEKQITEKNVKLLIVDSATSHFRNEYIGRETLAKRQQLLNQYLNKLIKLAKRYNLAVFITNQVTAKPDSFGISEKPIGGNILGHAVVTRLWIRSKNSKGVRVIRLLESPHLPDGEARFTVKLEGVTDVKKLEPEETDEKEKVN